MAKAIMIQGTASNAGKSLIVAGLCRIFKQDGYKVVPFKSQNMALNSYVTEDGFEMGRAQVMQAEACGIKPDVKMNPILLKPTSDKGSQVIVNGKSIGNMTAREYYKYKDKLKVDIKKAYEQLSKENDIIVIEGAGSPAEINLKENDIVNMGMAKMANAPVIIVGDIDRGGVFAALYGTVMLLEEEEKKLVKGFIINKFRGDIEILKPGLKQIEELTGIPVTGVVPYSRVNIDDEDSFSLNERIKKERAEYSIKICVIRLPRISNYTDFNCFERIEGVGIIYADSKEEIENSDMIIIPGSKNTIEDLIWMRENGIEATIKREAKKGKIIFGICGGYQMMGKRIEDTENNESGKTTEGMGLLDISTAFKEKKQTIQIEGKFMQVGGKLASLTGEKAEGYEIHMGVTKRNNEEIKPLVRIKRSTGEIIADGAEKGNCYGSYVHGIFDNIKVTEKVIGAICNDKGIDKPKVENINYGEYKESQYELLAEIVRESVDVKKIYEIMKR